jgi:hypothetical protein
MQSSQRRRRVEPTDEWEQVELLCGWPEQRDYELIRPMVLFGAPADGRAEETGASSGRALRRRAARFATEGMESLFGSGMARRRRLPLAMRRLIVDLKAEHPGFNPNEISRVCYVSFGRRPARKTVKRVLAEEPLPLRFVRRFPPYHEIPERRDGRAAVVQPIRNASVERFNSLDEVRYHLPYIKFGNGGGPPGDSTSKGPRHPRGH